MATLSIASVVSFCLCDYYNGKMTKLSTLEEGVSTCFTRLNQSYTAKMLGDGASVHLNASFRESTQECFSDVISYGEKTVRLPGKTVLGKLNAMSTQTYWFQQKLSGNKSFSDGETTLSGIMAQFADLQIAIDGVLIDLGKLSAYHSERSFFWICVTYALLFFTTWQALYGLFLSRNRRQPFGSSGKASWKKNGHSPETTVFFGDALAHSCDQTARRVFLTGTRLNIRIKKDIALNIQREILEDFLTDLFNTAMDLGSREIIVWAKDYSTKVNITVEVLGVKLAKEFLAWKQEGPYKELSRLEKTIGESGKVTFENTLRGKSFLVRLSVPSARVLPQKIPLTREKAKVDQFVSPL